MSLALQDFYEEIQLQIPALREIRDFQSAVNRTIETMNQKLPIVEQIETVLEQVTDPETLTLTFAAAGKTINDDGLGDFEVDYGFEAGQKIWFAGTGALNVTEMTIVSIQNDAATNDQITVTETIVNDASIEGELVGFSITTGYSWDNVNRLLTLKDAVKETLELYINDLIVTAKDHAYINNDDFEDEFVYNPYSRTEFEFPTWLMDELDDKVKLRFRGDISTWTLDDFTTDTVNIPQQLVNALRNGVYYHLYEGNKKYRSDEDTFKIKSQAWFNAIGDAEKTETDRIPIEENARDYDY